MTDFVYPEDKPSKFVYPEDSPSKPAARKELTDTAKTTAEGSLATGAKEAAMALPAGMAGWVGATAAGALAAPAAASVAAVNPLAGLAVEVGAMLVGGFGGSALGQKLVQEGTHLPGMQNLLSTIGLSDEQRAANIKENPLSAYAGQLAGQTLGGGMRPGIPSAAGAVVGASLNMGIEGGSQLAEGEFDPNKLGMAAAAGALTKQIGRGKAPIEKPPVADPTGRLVSTGLLDTATGKVTPTGPKHPRDAEGNISTGKEAVFVSDKGETLSRKEAAVRAKETGQIPPEHQLEQPEEGLHSGDLRTAGDEKFKVPRVWKEGDPLAFTDKHGFVHLNDKAITEDFHKGFPYIFDPATPTGAQKTKVFEILGLSKEDFAKLVNTPEKYKAFIQAHEESHVKNNDHSNYPRKYEEPKEPLFLNEQESYDRLKNPVNAQEQVKINKDIHREQEPVRIALEKIRSIRPQRADSPFSGTEIDRYKTVEEHLKAGSLGDELNLIALKHDPRGKLEMILEGYHHERSLHKEDPSDPYSKARLPVVEKMIADIELFEKRAIDRVEGKVKKQVDLEHPKALEIEIRATKDAIEAIKPAPEIPIPKDNKELGDALHQVETHRTMDKSEQVTQHQENTKRGITPEARESWARAEDGEPGRQLSPDEQAKRDAVIKPLDEELKALYDKAKGLGAAVGPERTTAPRHRLFADPNHPWTRMLKEFFENKMPLGDKVAEQAGAAKERTVFQTEDGKVIELAHGKGGTTVSHWLEGKKRKLSHSPEQLKVGDAIPGGAKIVDGQMHQIEKHSPYRYLKDAETTRRMAVLEMRAMVRELELIENLKKSPLFEQVGRPPETPIKDLPAGWKAPDGVEKIPQLRGWVFDPKTAAIIEDFAKVWDNNLWMKLSNAVVKNMMLNPLPHMFNEVMHLWNARGLSSWIPGTGGLQRLSDTGHLAVNDVMKQTPFYREVMREGGSILGADPRNNLFDTIVKHQSDQLKIDPKIDRSMTSLAKKLGTSVGDLYNGISKASQKAMWVTRDIMYVQYIREIQQIEGKRTGKEISVKEAVAKADKHMPNYRMPSEVLNSRQLAKILKNPNISMFSRYHYGMVNSLIQTVAELKPSNLKTTEGRAHFRDGIDSMLAIGVSLSILYPLMDKLVEQVFGSGAEQRRAGPYHLIKAGMDVASGKKDASALVWPVFTFNPMLLSLGQLAVNKEIFSGKPIYHPGDPAGKIASDVGKYAAKQLPQASTGVRGTDEAGVDLAKQYAAKQLDIKITPPKAQARADRAIKYGEAQKKRRLKEWLNK